MKVLSTFLAALLIGSASMVQAQPTDKVEVVVESNDMMKFDLSEIKVKAGQTVVLTLKHVGKLPAVAMGHNWVLLAPGVDMAAFAQKAVQAKATEYVPENSKEVLVATALIGGGEETTIEFVAPAAGKYDFICSFPGHYAMMKGKLIVE
tara:strand:- start:288 stop:734 length:447 start_codon:yes stop_codon:yes gene_type:complete